MTLAPTTRAANDNARKPTRPERLGAFVRLLRVGVAAGLAARALAEVARDPKAHDHQGGYSVDVRPGVRLTPAEALEVSRALGVRADLERGELRVYLGGEGSPACAGARACAEVLRDLGLVCAVGSWGLD